MDCIPSETKASYLSGCARMECKIGLATTLEATHVQIQIELLTSCHGNLRSHVERVVQPVSDEAFYQCICNDDSAESSSNLNARRKSNSSGMDSTTQQKIEEDFDTEDLIDQQASQRVRELRKRARDEAQHLQNQRITTIERAMALAKRVCDVLTKTQKDSLDFDGCGNIRLQLVSIEAEAKLTDTVSVSALDETVSNVRNALEQRSCDDTSRTRHAIRPQYCQQ